MNIEIAPSFFKSLRKLNSPFRWWNEFIYWIKCHFTRDFWNVLKETFKGYPYDAMFMVRMERAKLTEIANYIEKHKRYVGWEYDVRDIRIAISLIGIILEEKQMFHFNGDILFKPTANGKYELTHTDDFKYVCDVYVNTKNADRFIDDNRTKDFYISNPHELYIRKAMVLYNKMRNDGLYRWAD